MSNALIPTIVKYGNSVVEAYKRITKASKTEQEKAGLVADEGNHAIVGISAVDEYVVFQTQNIKKGSHKTFSTSRWGDDLEFLSIYIDAPDKDDFIIEVYLENGTKVTQQRIYKHWTPYRFPTNPLHGNLFIKITALQNIDFLRLTAKPCKILTTIFAEQDYEQ